MRAASFVLVGVVVGLVSCEQSPSLRAKLQARLAQLRANRDLLFPGARGVEKDGRAISAHKRRWKAPADRPDPGHQPFPFEMMTFLSLIGKCEVNRRIQEMLEEEQPEAGILTAACPAIMDVAVDMLEGSDEEIRNAEAFVKKHIPVFVCSNLKAEREIVALLVNDAGEDPEEDTYLNISEDFADICEDVLGNIEDEFIPDLEKLHNDPTSISELDRR